MSLGVLKIAKYDCVPLMALVDECIVLEATVNAPAVTFPVVDWSVILKDILSDLVFDGACELQLVVAAAQDG